MRYHQLTLTCLLLIVFPQSEPGYSSSPQSDTGFHREGTIDCLSNRGLVGRRPGSQGKRKAESELSSNPHTVKSRLRTLNSHSLEKRLEQAKRADISAISYHIKRLKNSTVYQNASDAEKQRLEARAKNDVNDLLTPNRIAQGKDASVLARRSGLTLHNTTILNVADNGGDGEFGDLSEEEAEQGLCSSPLLSSGFYTPTDAAYIALKEHRAKEEEHFEEQDLEDLMRAGRTSQSKVRAENEMIMFKSIRYQPWSELGED